jgi:hypothetical protein
MLSIRTPKPSTRWAAAIVVALLFTLAFIPTGWTSGGVVMPAPATPHGWSLHDMATAVAPFTRSGNDLAHYPETPFQVLYVTDIDFTAAGAGVLATGTNGFSVPLGTSFYVPVFNVNDVPPVLGEFPTTPAGAASYFFGQSQYGGRDFEVVVDGAGTPIGPAYLAGPVPVAGEETKVITLGAFVAPLGAGTHTVQIRGGVFGDLVDDTYGISFIQEDFTYTVQVVTG